MNEEAKRFETTKGPATMGPLTVHPQNPRYFADAEGHAVYLTGSHTWDVVQDIFAAGSAMPTSWDAFLAAVQEYGHNFVRLWTWEHARWAAWSQEDCRFMPSPWLRTGPGQGLDGELRFDLTRINPDWLERLRQRVETCWSAGMYASVMLFQGFSGGPKPGEPPGGNPWIGHPFNPSNNINGVDGSGGTEEGLGRVYTLGPKDVLDYQRLYVRTVIDALNQYPHIMFEIGNEFDGTPENTAWQYSMIDFVHSYEEREKTRQHPVIMSSQFPNPRGDDLFDCPAEAIAPSGWQGKGDERWEWDPPSRHTGKVVFLDTDHLWGIGGTADWVWRAFTRGYNPLYMDPWGAENVQKRMPAGDEALRRAMGETRRLAAEVDLGEMVPAPEIASTGFALFDGKDVAIVYQPCHGRISLDLGRNISGGSVEWRHPAGERDPVRAVVAAQRGRTAWLSPPWSGYAAAIVRAAK